jgi:thiol-disulfide isomerase/thioredoxin
MHDELPRQYGKGGFLVVLTIVAMLAICFALFIKAGMQPGLGTDAASLGKPFPPIEAEGWINGDAPTPEALRGRVLVVDAWAYWCGPCRMSTPHVIQIYEKFKDRDVTFIGLTSEGEDPKSLNESRQYVKSLHIPWLNGYAAAKTLLALEVEGIPQLWVVDRQNRIVFHETGWGDDSAPALENAIAKALASPATP